MTRYFVALVMIAAVLFPVAAQSLDEVQSRLLGGYSLPLRWYNIERSLLPAEQHPLLVEGNDPVTDGGSPRHLLLLGPGESATVWLPAWEVLRLDAANGSLGADDLEVAFSSGGGLYRHDGGTPSSDGKSLVFSPPSSSPLLARIVRPLRHQAPLAVAAFVSHHEPLGEIAPYRRLVRLPLQPVMLGRTGRPGQDTFWSMPAGQTISVHLTGPARVALENHLVFPGQEGRRSVLYRVETAIDNRGAESLEFETAPDMDPSRYEGELYPLLGRLQAGYIDVPAGEHNLTLKSSVHIYGRLLVQDRPDYLFPSLNSPNQVAASEDQGGIAPSLAGSFSGLDDRTVAETAADRHASPVLREKVALKIARDNQRREGGAVASALFRDAGRQRPDYPAVRARAEEFAASHTFYRDLLPESAGPSAAPVFRRFLPSRLAEPDANPFGRVVGEQHANGLAGMVAGGLFFNAPAGVASAYRYHLPTRFAPSLLRIAVPAATDREVAGLAVQFDDLPVQRLTISRIPELPAGTIPLSPAEAGLLLLADSHGSPLPLTLGGPFSALREPAPSLEAATLELNLPPEVKTVTLWKDGSSSRPLPVALQYRASAPYRLAETEYRETAGILAPGDSPFSAFTALVRGDALPEKSPAASPAPLSGSRLSAGREMESELLPLVRLIRSLERSYTATVAPPQKGNGPLSRPSSRELESSAAAARSAEESGDWLNALESWSTPARSGDGAMKREAVFAQIDALNRLNEDYLAERLLRGILLYGDDESRTEALSRLERLYAGTNDLESLLSLQATMLLRAPTPAILKSFGTTLQETGEQQLALQAFQILPRNERPRAAMLQAAYRLGWWQSFEEILSDVADPEERSLWQGLRSMSDGRYQEATGHLRNGGAEGNAWAKHLEEGLRIRSSLNGTDQAARLRAIVDWESWQAGYPGSRMWEVESGALAAAAGAVTLTNSARDTSFHALRATAEQPAVYRFAGPLRIRIEARPVHPAGSRTPLDGWLQVRDGERLYIQPITRNMPAQGLSTAGDDGHSAGLNVQRDIDLGPGIHELQVTGGSLPLIVRARAFRPAIPDPSLPPITPATFDAAVDGLYTSPQHLDESPIPRSERVFVVSREGNMAMRQLSFARRDFPVDGRREAPGDSGSRVRALAELATLRSPTVAGPDEQSALLLGRGDLNGAFAMAEESSGLDIVQRSILLLWVAEQQPDRYLPALTVAQVRAASHGEARGLSSVMGRISRRGIWVPVTSIAFSAGLRSVEVPGWSPETPALRISRALLPPTDDNELLLSDASRLVFTMVNKAETNLELTLSVDELPYLSPQPLGAFFQLDSGPLQRLTLRTGEPARTVSLQVPKGEHVVRVGTDERYTEQFLRLRLRERPAGKGGRESLAPTPAVKKIERPYHVATVREPVRLRMEGPALLRIDELRDGVTLISYRMIDAGPQVVEITPGPGREEGLYRFFTHAVVAEKPLAPARYVEVVQTPVPPPAITIASPPAPGTVRLTDNFTLGRQEDGTWSVTGALVRRKPVQEEGDGDTSPEQFLETSATYRYFNGERRYFEAGALARIRENGGPTLGVQLALSQLPLYLPFTWSLAGSVYVQTPNGSTSNPLKGPMEMSASLQGSIYQLRELSPRTWHRPSFSLFGRALSRSDILIFNREDVDQDIFTTYKRNHLYGASFSESLLHRPWLDTLWLGTVSLTTNEFDEVLPDHLSLSLGWKQLLKDFQLNARYMVTGYTSDQNRPGSLFRNNIGAELIYDRWLWSLDRIEVGARVNWHFETRDLTTLLAITWHFDNGRGFRDFFSGDVDFHDLRRRMVPASNNNGMTYEPN